MGFMILINRTGTFLLPQRAHLSVYVGVVTIVLNLNLHVCANYI